MKENKLELLEKTCEWMIGEVRSSPWLNRLTFIQLVELLWRFLEFKINSFLGKSGRSSNTYMVQDAETIKRYMVKGLPHQPTTPCPPQPLGLVSRCLTECPRCISANMNLNASLSPAFNKHKWWHIRHSVLDFCNAFYQQFFDTTNNAAVHNLGLCCPFPCAGQSVG